MNTNIEEHEELDKRLNDFMQALSDMFYVFKISIIELVQDSFKSALIFAVVYIILGGIQLYVN